MSTSNDDLKARIKSLERRVSLLALAMGLGVASTILVAASRPDTYQASAFQLLSEDGSVRGEMAFEGGQPVLHLKDESGTNRVSLFHQEDASGLYVRDLEGVTRIGVAQFTHGGGGVALHGPGSKGAAVLYLKGTGSLRFFDTSGAIRSEFPGVESDGSPE